VLHKINPAPRKPLPDPIPLKIQSPIVENPVPYQWSPSSNIDGTISQTSGWNDAFSRARIGLPSTTPYRVPSDRASGAGGAARTDQFTGAPTEISAAFLTGIGPSNKKGKGVYSSGAHNFPRFLENLNNQTVAIRGAFVAMFESRVATEPWGVVGYYSAPNRLWGRNELFAGGAYPPFTPLLLSFRRGAFVEVPPSQYHTAVNNLNLQH